MKNYRLFQWYVLNHGLTFLPKGLSTEQWRVANKLMADALLGKGPAVTHRRINARCQVQSSR
jgi:hypothetical protein